MIDEDLSTTESAAILALAVVGVSLFLALIRLVRGPTLPDRIVALDLMGVMTVGMIAAYAVSTNQPLLLDPAAVLALVGFLGTAAFSRFLERRARDD